MRASMHATLTEEEDFEVHLSKSSDGEKHFVKIYITVMFVHPCESASTKSKQKFSWNCLLRKMGKTRRRIKQYK